MKRQELKNGNEKTGMKKQKNSLFLRACFREKTERTPIWIMRQAGRYLPEYRKVREKVSFLKLCKTPELAAKVTLQPIELLKVDAAIIFSDILIVPEAMGMKLSIEEKQGPRLNPPIRQTSDLKKIKIPKPEKAYDYLGNAIRWVKKELNGKVPLIGFAGSPWTLLAYMVEGQGSKDFLQVKKFVYDQKKSAHQLLDSLTRAVSDLLNYQIESGAEAIQIFDSWGGILSRDDFFEFSFPYVQKVISKIKRKNIPVIFFAKGTGQHLEKIISCGADVISLDWTIDLGWASSIAKNKVALQGNLDPCLLFASPKNIREETKNILRKIPENQSHIFNLGHGILPKTPVESVKEMIRFVKSQRKSPLEISFPNKR